MRTRTKKRNPADAAADLSRSFHGREPEEAVDLDERLHVHSVLTTLGDLKEIKLARSVRLTGFQGALLASNESGTQMFVRGGDQQVDLSAFPEVDPTKERVVLGEVKRIVYVTDKQHLGAEDRKRGPYEHTLGEEGGTLPFLIYDTVNRKLEFAGGTYKVEPEGIRD